MNARSISQGLGVFSIGLGLAELIAGRRIADALDAPDRAGLVRAFGAREVVAGLGLIQSPAHGVRVWNRVAGDVLDLAALGFAARNSPRNRVVWGALAFVAVATVIDAATATALDRSTGKTLPIGR